MTCPLCNYAMDAFDKECLRCHGKGLAPAATATPAASAAQTQVLPPQQAAPAKTLPVRTPPVTTPVTTTPVTTTPPVAPPGGSASMGTAPAGTIYPGAAGQSAPLPPDPYASTASNFDQHLIAFAVSALVFCLGYLAPWVSISFFGISTGSGGPMGLEFFVVILAIVAAGVCIYERTQQFDTTLPQIRTALSAICFIFAAGYLLYFSFMSHIIQLGFGLPLMLIAAGIMVFLSLGRVPPVSRSPVLPVAGVALLAVLAWSGYKGYDVRKKTDFSNIFAGAGSNNPLLNPNNAAPNPAAVNTPPKPRPDVEVRLNTSSPIVMLQPTSDFYKPLSPDPGKAFLSCNVTVTFKGTTGTLDVGESDFRINASNKQVYHSSTLLTQYSNFKPIEATLLPGGTITGDVLFEVDAGASVDTIEFKDGLL